MMSKLFTQKLEELISDNKDIFYKELKEVIKPSFTGLDNPEKYKDILENFISISNRESFPRQARLVSAATEFITKKANKSLLISAEMGTGKTDMAVKIAMATSIGLSKKAKFAVNFIMCPPHLVDKWADEIKINYKNPLAYKIIKVNRWEDLVPYTKRDMRKDSYKYYFIISRETAKLGYPKQVAVNVKRRYITTEQELDGQTEMFSQLVKVATCPDCATTLQEGTAEFIDLDSIPYKCECGSVLRQVDKTVSPKMQSRVSIAEYVKRNWTKGQIDLLVVDEIHEYKGGNTGQGNALAQLASMSKKIVGLTGTLLNGYASSLFYILYRLNPNLMKKQLGFDYNQVQLFINRYGAVEETFEAKEIDMEGKVTKMGKKVGVSKEKPKISPYLLSVLLNMTIFLRLDEIKMKDGAGLPDYDESIELVTIEPEIQKPYMQYLSEITSRIRKDKRFLGNLANDAIAVPDMPFQVHSAQDEIFYEPTLTREDYGYTNKEKSLVNLVKEEFNQNRKVLVYNHFSNKGVGDDLLEILNKEFPGKVIKILKANVAARKRQAWITNNPCDILICNPELVKTGLDLLEFPTIIFYETTYNVFTLKQASRRSWRIGQTSNVKVMFMAYRDTPQHKALELIGAKVAAANSLEGRLSGDDDLSSMGEDDDNIQLALARAILNGESASKDIKMNSIKNFGNDRDYDAFETYYLKLLEENKPKTYIAKVQNEEVKVCYEPEHQVIDAGDMVRYKGAWVEVDYSNDKHLIICDDATNHKILLLKDVGLDIDGHKHINYPTGAIAICVSPVDDIIKMYDTPRHVVLYTLDNNPNPSRVEMYERAKAIKADLIKNAVQNEKDGLSVHDGHGGNWGSNLADLFGIASQSPNIQICSMPKSKTEVISTPVQETPSFVAYIGKGKKQRKVEVKASNNLFDSAFENLSGVQLAFNF